MPPATPGPLYVPPAGNPPVRVKAGVFRQTVRFAGQVITGKAFTVITNVQLFEQFVAGSVKEYVIVLAPLPATDGLKTPPDTPGPL
jgi:hypothetical protein